MSKRQTQMPRETALKGMEKSFPHEDVVLSGLSHTSNYTFFCTVLYGAVSLGRVRKKVSLSLIK